jgi:hypothetical protein
MPPPPRPPVPDPSTWQVQDNNGGRIARENADRRRRFVAAQSGSIEPPFPPALSGESISGGGDAANFSGTVSDPITEPGPTFHFVSGKLDLNIMR